MTQMSWPRPQEGSCGWTDITCVSNSVRQRPREDTGAVHGVPHQPRDPLPASASDTLTTRVVCHLHGARTFSSLLSLQQEHVGVLGTSVHIFPDSLQKEKGAVTNATCCAKPRKAPQACGPVSRGGDSLAFRPASKSETQQVPSRPPLNGQNT